MASNARNTDIGKLLEKFLDDNEQDLSPNMFSALEEVAEEVDSMVDDLLVEIEERKEELDEIRKELEEE